jgi:hypothetical protein
MTAIAAGLFDGTLVVNAAERLGFMTSTEVTVASITYKIYIIKMLLESVKEIKGVLLKEVIIAVPDNTFVLHQLHSYCINSVYLQ